MGSSSQPPLWILSVPYLPYPIIVSMPKLCLINEAYFAYFGHDAARREFIVENISWNVFDICIASPHFSPSLSLTLSLLSVSLSLSLSTSTLCNWTPSCCVCANSNWQIYLQCWVSQVGARVNAGKWVCLIAMTEREREREGRVGCCYSTNYTIATQTAASSLFDRRVN